MAAHLIVWADLFLRHASILLGHRVSNQQQHHQSSGTYSWGLGPGDTDKASAKVQLGVCVCVKLGQASMSWFLVWNTEEQCSTNRQKWPKDNIDCLLKTFPTGMVCLYYISCLRYTILVGNPRIIFFSFTKGERGVWEGKTPQLPPPSPPSHLLPPPTQATALYCATPELTSCPLIPFPSFLSNFSQ